MEIKSGDWIIFVVRRGLRSYSQVIRTPQARFRTVATRDGIVYRSMICEVVPTRELARTKANQFNQGAEA